MTTTNLPPQAYTRETLANAFEWLKNQPAATREIAKSADELVGLFLTARRHRQTSSKFTHNSDAPVSTKNFQSDLKNLAENMKVFDKEPSVTTAATAAPLQPQAPTLQSTAPTLQTTAPAPQAMSPAPQLSPQIQTAALDEKSRQIIEFTKSNLNLSSDQEALRMLIVLGFERAREIFPK